ncbi:hypothetical protein [Dinghuibacter silviterrae]|uniref:Uncharacterized protein n=1 Tax=Dinghuibacter silviterrae TaxID=1539049 RepID=A0A4R8DP73_9BACT|nr:hypothetical protein [Dinghuibacter silviterrae]TDW99863.1 hypothetical protein EDB95_0877 [Dinghuibacter silviterrae]
MILLVFVLVLTGIIIFGIPFFTGVLMSLLLWQARRKKVVDARPWIKALMFAVSLLGATVLSGLVVYVLFEYLPA